MLKLRPKQYSKLQTNRIFISPAFTIIELLVVIVVIGILAAITIVSYTGITQRAVTSSLQSDLSNTSQQLKLYYQLYSSYPTAMTANCPTAPTADNTYCLKASTGNTLTYTSITPNTFHLTDTNTNNNSYSATDSTSPAIATTTAGSSTGSSCPTGFIPVPGSGTYGTNDFCVMKYEAKQVGSTTTPISQVAGTPWVNISQTTAIANSPNVANCTGCHLITEAERMTIAQNVLSVSTNWSGNAVGNGYIPRGNSDSSVAMDGATDLTGINKRTLILTNGEVIWDFAGNVMEWTQGTIGANSQPGLSGEVTYTWREWNNGSILQNGLPNSATPGYIGLSGASGWSSTQGIGELKSNYGETVIRGFLRGGDYLASNLAGVLGLYLNFAPSDTYAAAGFRVSR